MDGGGSMNTHAVRLGHPSPQNRPRVLPRRRDAMVTHASSVASAKPAPACGPWRVSLTRVVHRDDNVEYSPTIYAREHCVHVFVTPKSSAINAGANLAARSRAARMTAVGATLSFPRVRAKVPS